MLLVTAPAEARRHQPQWPIEISGGQYVDVVDQDQLSFRGASRVSGE
jgi:hypothetical protein